MPRLFENHSSGHTWTQPTRRSAVNMQIKNLGYFLEICSKAETTRDACLVALLYLSARRLMEVLPLQKKNFAESDEEYLRFETLNEKCFRSKPMGNYTLKIGKRYYERILCECSKTTAVYKLLGRFVEKRLSEINEEEYLFAPFRKRNKYIQANMGYKIITNLVPELWPHALRHQRLSQVTETLKNLPTADLIYSLKEFSKHHRTDSTLAYIHRMRTVEIRKQI